VNDWAVLAQVVVCVKFAVMVVVVVVVVVVV
jgi:hypothetical protein